MQILLQGDEFIEFQCAVVWVQQVIVYKGLIIPLRLQYRLNIPSASTYDNCPTVLKIVRDLSKNYDVTR